MNQNEKMLAAVESMSQVVLYLAEDYCASSSAWKQSRLHELLLRMEEAVRALQANDAGKDEPGHLATGC